MAVSPCRIKGSRTIRRTLGGVAVPTPPLPLVPGLYGSHTHTTPYHTTSPPLTPADLDGSSRRTQAIQDHAPVAHGRRGVRLPPPIMPCPLPTGTGDSVTKRFIHAKVLFTYCIEKVFFRQECAYASEEGE